MTKREAKAEQLLGRLWKMIQGNQLNHYTDDLSQAQYYADEKYEKDRAAFRDLYREVHDFDPDDSEIKPTDEERRRCIIASDLYSDMKCRHEPPCTKG